MDDADKREFAQTLQGLGEVRGKPLSKAALSVYWLALSDWDISEFRAVAKHLLTHSQFMPTPYDFEQARKVDDTADEAWLQVLQAIRTRHHSEDQYPDQQPATTPQSVKDFTWTDSIDGRTIPGISAHGRR
jgi:hypothetical protein